MFNWLKKKLTKERDGAAEEEEERAFTDTLQLVTAWDVVDRFLTNNPAPTPYVVHALVEAGACDLLESDELLTACEKIQEHGYQFPINGVLIAELDQSELLSYLRWHAQTGVAKESYDNEPKIRELIERFRSSR